MEDRGWRATRRRNGRAPSSVLDPPPSPSRRAFTLIEMLTTVAVLIIVLGLMVSLARNVRDQSAQQLTKQLLRQLAVLVGEYSEANGRQALDVTPIIPPDSVMPPEEPSLELLAMKNNEEFVRALRPWLARLEQRQRSNDSVGGESTMVTGAGAGAGAGATTTSVMEDTGAGAGTGASVAPDAARPSIVGQLPVSVYDGVTLRDAWGSPIVFMPTQNRWIGMAPKGREGESYFFFSAGPDRRYLTRDDNLYSYETVAGEP